MTELEAKEKRIEEMTTSLLGAYNQARQFDGVLMLDTIKDMAKYLVNKYKLSEADFEAARKIELHYDAPYEYKFAVVEYYARQGKPLKVVSYYIYGEELKTGRLLRCWTGYPSTNWSVLEDDFATYAEAEIRMKEIKEARKHGTSNNM